MGFVHDGHDQDAVPLGDLGQPPHDLVRHVPSREASVVRPPPVGRG